MSAVFVIVWVLAMCLSTAVVFELAVLRRLVQMFPEGNSAWLTPVQLASLAIFALVVLSNPWNGFWV